MRALRLLFTAFLALIAIFAAITIFLGRLLGRSNRNSKPPGPVEQGRTTAKPSEDVIDVETTVVSAEQGDR